MAFKTKEEKRYLTHKQIEQFVADGKYEDAIRLCDLELEKKQDERQFMEDKADVLVKMCRYDEAGQLYDMLIQRYPSEDSYKEKKGDLLQMLGYYDKAYECYPFISFGKIIINLLIAIVISILIMYFGYHLYSIRNSYSIFANFLGICMMISSVVIMLFAIPSQMKSMFRIKRKKKKLKNRLSR